MGLENCGTAATEMATQLSCHVIVFVILCLVVSCHVIVSNCKGVVSCFRQEALHGVIALNPLAKT